MLAHEDVRLPKARKLRCHATNATIALGILAVDTDNRCSHGPLFWAYLAAVALVVAIVLVELLRYGKSFRR